MTSLTTPQMINYARAWFATQINSTPRDILQPLYDMAVALLETDNPANPPPVMGETSITTPQLLDYANKWLDGAGSLPPKDFLVQVKVASLALLQQLPKWKCSMFFKGADGAVDSSLNFANIDGSETTAHRNYSCDAIRRIGGDTLMFIGEKLFRNPQLQAEVDAALNYGVGVGLRHLIIDLRNDVKTLRAVKGLQASKGFVPKMAWTNVEESIKTLAEHYAGFNSDQVAFMTCLESDEIMSLAEVRQVVYWCKQYAPLKRVIVGSANVNYLKSIGNGAELWLEIHTSPFNLSQADADIYIANLQSLLPYGPVWAGEFWDGSSELSKYISRRALEIGCAGVGSWVG